MDDAECHRFSGRIRVNRFSLRKLVRQNYLPPPRGRNFGQLRESYGKYDLPVFSRIWVSTVDLGSQSSILLSGGGGRK